ncbi:MAG TPA: hypothetical protein VFY72_04395 [Beijerinckiaceae bacterium]|jgi:hypothetical protein|nr:hypothetical protein [Beijerinckiaceae bacterium]
MSRRRIALGLGLAALLAAPPVIYFSDKLGHEHELDKTLKGMGFLPINPPSTLLRVGSLFYVDPQVKFFRTVCRADPSYVETVVVDSPGTRMLADLLEKGTYSLDLKLDLSGLARGNAKAADEFSRRVKFTLSDVKLFELDLRNSRYIFDKMLEDKYCEQAVREVLDAKGYVCQGQGILHASAEYSIKAEEGTNADAEVEPGKQIIKEAIKDAVKDAVREQQNVVVIEKSGRLQTGSSLHYGVVMNPTCVAPRNAVFARALPRNALERVANYVKLRIVEPLVRRDDDPSRLVAAVSDRR